ncbi:MAG: prepilin-type N-terminal cleavage/methylation domain-containing protein [Geminicoccaceae bacterium]
MIGWRRCRSSAGFTLLELLIAITLLGLLMAALFGGLRLGARAWERSEQRLDQSTRLQVVQNFVRERLAQAYPLSTEDETGRLRLAFEGDGDSLRFVTLMPAYLGTGFAELVLAIDDRSDAKDLVVRWRPFELPPQLDDEDEPQIKVLLDDIEALEIAYFGALDRGAPALWHEQWQGVMALPELVRLRVVFAEDDRRYWPDLIVRPVTDAPPPLF